MSFVEFHSESGLLPSDSVKHAVSGVRQIRTGIGHALNNNNRYFKTITII